MNYRDKVIYYLSTIEITPDRSSGKWDYPENWLPPQIEWRARFGENWSEIPLIDLMIGGSDERRQTD